MAEALVEAELQGVVVGDAYGAVEIGIRIVPDIRSTESRVARTEANDESVYVLSSQRQRSSSQGGGITRSYSGRRSCTIHIETIRVVLLERASSQRRVLCCGNSSLIERQGNRFVDAVIPHVAKSQDQGIARLPLEVQSPVF